MTTLLSLQEQPLQKKEKKKKKRKKERERKKGFTLVWTCTVTIGAAPPTDDVLSRGAYPLEVDGSQPASTGWS